MALAVMKKGPVLASFNVFSDFLLYKKGIYVQTSDKMMGVHAVKVLGWGYDKDFDVNYWIC
jgi:cathepsin B